MQIFAEGRVTFASAVLSFRSDVYTKTTDIA